MPWTALDISEEWQIYTIITNKQTGTRITKHMADISVFRLMPWFSTLRKPLHSDCSSRHITWAALIITLNSYIYSFGGCFFYSSCLAVDEEYIAERAAPRCTCHLIIKAHFILSLVMFKGLKSICKPPRASHITIFFHFHVFFLHDFPGSW